MRYGEDDVPVGTVVRQHRTAAGLTQRQLASVVGMSIGALRDLEQGRTLCPRWGSMEDLASVLDLSQDDRAELLRAWRVRAQGGLASALRDQPAARVDVLGPLVARVDGMPMKLGSARQRTVLAMLGLQQGSWLHRDAVIDVLWHDRPPASAVAAVQGYISRLRQDLGPARKPGESSGLISSTGTSYQLKADEVHVDLVAFERLVKRADQAMAQHDPGGACDFYEQAVSQWRGDVLADIDLLRQYPAVTALTCRRADVVVRYAAAAAQSSAHIRALPHLRTLCAMERFNEQAHAQLMITLAAVGQQAVALQVFVDLRQRLDKELGIRPSATLERIHVQVLRQQ